MITKDELDRIYEVAKTNNALEAQLNKLKTTWQVVDSEYASLLSEIKDANEQMEKIEKQLHEIALKRNRARNRMDEIAYGKDYGNGQMSNTIIGGINMAKTVPQTWGYSGSCASGNATQEWPYPNGTSSITGK